jgi:hypothetical protein
MSVFKPNPKYDVDRRGLPVPSAANDTLREAAHKKKRNLTATRVITFDDRRRTSYLTGFQKRRQERRRRGYLQKLDAERNERLELRRERRREQIDLLLTNRNELFTDAPSVPEIDTDASAAQKKKRKRAGLEEPTVQRYEGDDVTATVVVEPLGSVRNSVLEVDALLNRSMRVSRINDARRQEAQEAKEKRRSDARRRVAGSMKRKQEREKRQRISGL